MEDDVLPSGFFGSWINSLEDLWSSKPFSYKLQMFKLILLHMLLHAENSRS